MHGHEREKVVARHFLQLHGDEFGLGWDEERDCLDVGPRTRTGESRGRQANHSNFFRGGRTPGQPASVDAYGSVEIAEAVADAAPLHYDSSAGGDTEIERALSDLDPELQSIVIERFQESATLRTIADRRSLSYQAVQSRLSTALRKLRDALTE